MLFPLFSEPMLGGCFWPTVAEGQSAPQDPKETSPILDNRHPKDVVLAYSGGVLR
jgi:hypothetical protein